MLTKLFDCQLDAGYPKARILVEVPETAQEALELVNPDRLADLAKHFPGKPTEEQLAARDHEMLRAAVMTKIVDAERATWTRENAASPDDEPEGPPATFEAAWPEIFLRADVAARFARADARSEYFRLYGVTDSCAALHLEEIKSDVAPPDPEHKNWSKIRKQIKTFGTERQAGARTALLATIGAAKAKALAAEQAEKQAAAKPATQAEAVKP